MSENEKKIILVVDDEAELCDALCFELQEAGYTALTAYSGDEALAVLDAQHVDMIISDVRMPHGNGVELLKIVKERDSENPIVLLTSGYTDVKIDEAYHIGTEGFFVKPFKIEALLAKIQKCFEPVERRWERSSLNQQSKLSASVFLKFPGFNSSVQTSLINVGRGGMCISLKNELPAVGQMIDFEVAFADGRWSPIAGTGIIKWRKLDEAQELKQFGIEFVSLTEESLPKFLALIEHLQPTAYIPSN